jgi:hippurate hydrolase
MAALIEPAGASAPDGLRAGVAADLPALTALYRDLHAHPELAFMETRTAARMAAEARAAGFAVTEKVGGTGVVAVLDNGPGPVVLIRADMDGLPVREETGLPYASTVTGKSREGEENPVMHACGHDLHMLAWVGAARRLAAARDQWRGRVIMVAQPAEERVLGARAMLADGLYARFGTPSHILAFHDSASQPAGEIGVTPGPAMAAVDTVDIIVKGVGGHGAYPHLTKDPVVLASRIVVGLQTIVSREVDPQDAAVVTVGAIDGGTKHNIIPDEVRLKITLRSFSPEQRARLVEAVKRTARGEAIAMGMAEERMPEVIVSPEGAYPTINTPDFARQMADLFAQRFPGRVRSVPAVMAAEDFNEFGRAAPEAKTLLFWVGAQPQAAWDAAGGDLTKLPPLHSARFAPDPGPTIATAAEALAAAALHILARP